MAEYTVPLVTLEPTLMAQLGADVSREVVTLLTSGQAGQSPDPSINVVMDYAGGVVPAGTDLVYVAYTNTAPIGNDLANVPVIIMPEAGSSTVVLSGGVDHIINLGGGSDTVQISGSTNDLIAHVGNNSIIDTGAGFDQVVIAGSLADYHTQVTTDGIVLTNQNGDTVQVLNAEYVQFADGSVIINAPTAEDAAISGLYNAVLNRTADSPGTEYWWSASTGQSAVDLADTFLRSQEFTLAHGNVDQLTNSDFLDIMYFNALGRVADAAGKAYWMSVMDSGATKAQIALYFAQSAEAADQATHKVNVIPDILT